MCCLKWMISSVVKKRLDLVVCIECKELVDELSDMVSIVEQILVSIGAWCSINNTLSIASRRAARSIHNSDTWNTCMLSCLQRRIIKCKKLFIPNWSTGPLELFMTMNLESGNLLFNAFTAELSLLLKSSAASLNSATQFPLVPRVDMACGVQPREPNSATATFLAPLSCSSCHPIHTISFIYIFVILSSILIFREIITTIMFKEIKRQEKFTMKLFRKNDVLCIIHFENKKLSKSNTTKLK